VALLICAETARHVEQEDALLRDELRRKGFRCDCVVWTDSKAVEMLKGFHVAVVRSTWDYFVQVDRFLAFLDEIVGNGILLLNQRDVIVRNSDKRYLFDLERRGCTIVPSVLMENPSMSLEEASKLLETTEGEFVLKPVISAGSHLTFKLKMDQMHLFQEKVQEIFREHGSAVLLQPFVREIVEEGEWSFVFFSDEFSHALLKRPKPGDFRVQAEYGGHEVFVENPPENFIQQAKKALDCFPGEKCFARVDGVFIGSGRTFHVSEIELIEPSLYLVAVPPDRVSRFADSILSCARKKLGAL